MPGSQCKTSNHCRNCLWIENRSLSKLIDARETCEKATRTTKNSHASEDPSLPQPPPDSSIIFILIKWLGPLYCDGDLWTLNPKTKQVGLQTVGLAFVPRRRVLGFRAFEFWV